MRKWLALTIQIPFIALVWAGCNGGDENTDAGGTDGAPVDVTHEKIPLDVQQGEPAPECAPSTSIDTSQITWVPPLTPDPNACSATQIQAYFDDCLGTNATSTACQGFTNLSANATCYACLLTPQTKTAYGALIAIGGVDYANISGCIAILTNDTSSTGCGAKEEAVTECDTLACQPNCPDVTDQTSFQQYEQCTQGAEAAVCKPYVDAECDLSDAGAVYATCINHSSFQDYYNAIAPVFCGGYADDGGTDGGTDASTDASTDADDGGDADDGATE